MSQTIPIAWVNQYKDNVTMLYQQAGSKLRGTVRERPVTGASDFWDLLGPTAAIKKTVRHADTPQVDSQHTRRMVVPEDWEWADLIDKQDLYRILIDPESSYAINAAKAMQRAFDDEVITAFDGTAQTGVAGATAVTFANDWPTTRGAAQGDEDFTSAALTVPNLTTIKADLDNNDVDDDRRFIIMSPYGIQQLLKASSAPFITSSDYNTVKALVDGDIDTYMGFKFIRSTRLPSPSSNLRYGYAWQENAMGISVGMDMMTRVTERADKSYATQVYCAMSLGATRIQGNGVVRFKIDETK
jgi:hypothetical protein